MFRTAIIALAAAFVLPAAANAQSRLATQDSAQMSRVTEQVSEAQLASETIADAAIMLRDLADAGEGGEPVGKRVPTNVHIYPNDHIDVTWSDGTESTYCYNQETGQYVLCN
ncbi:MAG: hypothetical protein ACE366_02955 [Bradymonadia bacterium]